MFDRDRLEEWIENIDEAGPWVWGFIGLQMLLGALFCTYVPLCTRLPL
jgi:hypothetical protein